LQFNITGSQCYTCWYFIKIKVNDPYAANYRITISQVDENLSGLFREIRTDNPVQVYIASSYFDRRKFLLSSMDNFAVEAFIANGQIDMYIGLDPATVGPDNYIWKGTQQSSQVNQI
jgi:hypothetical protein